MTTTYELALRMVQAGRSEEEIVPILQKITGKDKPGSTDQIPEEVADQLAPQLNEGTISKVAEVAKGAGFRPEVALEGGYQTPREKMNYAGNNDRPTERISAMGNGIIGRGNNPMAGYKRHSPEQIQNRVKPEIRAVPNAQPIAMTPEAQVQGMDPEQQIPTEYMNAQPRGLTSMPELSATTDLNAGPQGPQFQPDNGMRQGSQEYGQGVSDMAPNQGQSGGLLDSLKSIGRGMGDYAGKLFDDPNRMALLQGGLSMMDPNSYYDKQGFGSVFTGLNNGLGAAQQGQKGVFDRRQAIANVDKTRAESAYALSGKGGAGSSEYERLSKVTMDLNATPMQRQLAQQRIDKLTESEGSGSMDRQESKYIFEQLPETQKTVQSLRKLTHAIGLVDSDTGIMTGPGTNPLIGFGNFLVSKMGMDLGDNETQRLEGTREYIAIMGSQVADAITAFGAGTGLSDADRTFAEGMVGADPSKFTKAGLKKLLMFNELNSRMKVTEYNSIASEVASRDTKHKYLVRKLPPMSKALKDHIISNKKNGLLGDNPEKPEGWVGDWDAIKVGKAQGTSPSSGGFTIELYKE